MNEDFIYGADISSLLAVEELGGAFSNEKGEKEDLLAILSTNGFNLARVRLFVNPKTRKGESYGTGHNDLESALTLAKRAKEQGFALLLDLHYSDFWANTNHQVIPKAWAKLDFAGIEYEVYSYTKSVVQKFNEENITLDYIQIGNAIDKGILWPHGRLYRYKKATGREFDRLAILLNAGIKAVREVSPNTKVMIHLEDGDNPEKCRDFLHFMEPRLFHFDALGFSYFPYKHSAISELEATLLFVKTYYPYECFVVETSYPFENGDETSRVTKEKYPPKKGFLSYTEVGQARALETVVEAALKYDAKGVVYFEAGWINVSGLTLATVEGLKYLKDKKNAPGETLFNEALFSRSGKPNAALYIKSEIEKRK